MNEPSLGRRSWGAGRRACGVFLRDVADGLLQVGRQTLALLGLLVVAALLFALGRADVRKTVENHAFDWLLQRHEASAESAANAPGAAAQAVAVVANDSMAVDPAGLNRQQAAIANWLSRRYRVAPEPVARLVEEAWQVGHRVGLDPTLILAVMAVESSFNPFAQSPVGAQGLMQVMTRVHTDKYQAFGGHLAAFDPVTNLRVGVQVLKECIARAGNLQAGLRYYVGAAGDEDGGYAAKVLAEQDHLSRVSRGQNVSVTVAFVPPATSSAAPAAAASGAAVPAPNVTPPAVETPTEKPADVVASIGVHKLKTAWSPRAAGGFAGLGS